MFYTHINSGTPNEHRSHPVTELQSYWYRLPYQYYRVDSNLVIGRVKFEYFFQKEEA